MQCSGPFRSVCSAARVDTMATLPLLRSVFGVSSSDAIGRSPDDCLPNTNCIPTHAMIDVLDETSYEEVHSAMVTAVNRHGLERNIQGNASINVLELIPIGLTMCAEAIAALRMFVCIRPLPFIGSPT